MWYADALLGPAIWVLLNMIAMQRGEPSVVASLYRLMPRLVLALNFIAVGESIRPRRITGGC
jgi:hypothetical protein